MSNKVKHQDHGGGGNYKQQVNTEGHEEKGGRASQIQNRHSQMNIKNLNKQTPSQTSASVTKDNLNSRPQFEEYSPSSSSSSQGSNYSPYQEQKYINNGEGVKWSSILENKYEEEDQEVIRLKESNQQQYEYQNGSSQEQSQGEDLPIISVNQQVSKQKTAETEIYRVIALKQNVQGLDMKEQEEIKRKLKSQQREISEPPKRMSNQKKIKANQRVSNYHDSIIDNVVKERREEYEEEEEDDQFIIQRIEKGQSLSNIQGRGQSVTKKQDKGFYPTMIPSFTNEKRKKLYYNDPKHGFTYINWDIEDELWRFQKEIESKFSKSSVNQQFKFPKIKISHENQSKSPNEAKIKQQKYVQQQIEVQQSLQRKNKQINYTSIENSNSNNCLSKQSFSLKQNLQKQPMQSHKMLDISKTRQVTNTTTSLNMNTNSSQNKSKRLSKINQAKQSKILKERIQDCEDQEGGNDEAMQSPTLISQKQKSRIKENQLSSTTISNKLSSILGTERGGVEKEQESKKQLAAFIQHAEEQLQISQQKVSGKLVKTPIINQPPTTNQIGSTSNKQGPVSKKTHVAGKHNPTQTMIDFSTTLEQVGGPTCQKDKLHQNLNNKNVISRNQNQVKNKHCKTQSSKMQTSLKSPIISSSSILHTQIGQQQHQEIQKQSISIKEEQSLSSPVKSTSIFLPVFKTKCKQDKDVQQSSRLAAASMQQTQNQKTKCYNIILKKDQQVDLNKDYNSNQTDEMDEYAKGLPLAVLNTEPPVYNSTDIAMKSNKNSTMMMNAFYQSYCNQVPTGQVKSRNGKYIQGAASSSSLLGTGGGVSNHCQPNNNNNNKEHQYDQNQVSLNQLVGAISSNNTKPNNLQHEKQNSLQSSYKFQSHFTPQLASIKNKAMSQNSASGKKSERTQNSYNNNAKFVYKPAYHFRFKSSSKTINCLKKNVESQREKGLEADKQIEGAHEIIQTDRNNIRNSSPTKTNLQVLNYSHERLNNISQQKISSFTLSNRYAGQCMKLNGLSQISQKVQKAQNQPKQQTFVQLNNWKGNNNQKNQSSMDNLLLTKNCQIPSQKTLFNMEHKTDGSDTGSLTQRNDYAFSKKNQESYSQQEHEEYREVDMNELVEKFDEEMNYQHQVRELKYSIIEESAGGNSNVSSLLETGKQSYRNTLTHQTLKSHHDKNLRSAEHLCLNKDQGGGGEGRKMYNNLRNSNQFPQGRTSPLFKKGLQYFQEQQHQQNALQSSQNQTRNPESDTKNKNTSDFALKQQDYKILQASLLKNSLKTNQMKQNSQTNIAHKQQTLHKQNQSSLGNFSLPVQLNNNGKTKHRRHQTRNIIGVSATNKLSERKQQSSNGKNLLSKIKYMKIDLTYQDSRVE